MGRFLNSISSVEAAKVLLRVDYKAYKNRLLEGLAQKKKVVIKIKVTLVENKT